VGLEGMQRCARLHADHPDAVAHAQEQVPAGRHRIRFTGFLRTVPEIACPRLAANSTIYVELPVNS
jgi:hypothetical protein